MRSKHEAYRSARSSSFRLVSYLLRTGEDVCRARTPITAKNRPKLGRGQTRESHSSGANSYVFLLLGQTDIYV